MNTSKIFFLSFLFLLPGCIPLKKISEDNRQLKKELYSTKSDIKSLKNRLKENKEKYDTLLFQHQRMQFRMDSLSKIITQQMLKNKASREEIKTKKPLEFKWRQTSRIVDVNNNESINIQLENISFHAYSVNDPKQIQFFWKDSKGNIIGNLGNLIDDSKKDGYELIFGMNGGIFTPSRTPEGLFIQRKKEIVELNTERKKGNFYLEPNGVFFIEESGKSHVMNTKDFISNKEKFNIVNATQSGPMLVINGKIHSAFQKESNNINIRNGVGVDDYGNVIFIISDKAVNLYTFASIFKEHFNCKNALYLDGAISKAYIPNMDRHSKGGDFGPLIGIFKKNETQN